MLAAGPRLASRCIASSLPGWAAANSSMMLRVSSLEASLPTMTSLMIKESVNQTVDNQGFYNALQATFTLHQLNHAHWAEVHEDGWPAARPEDGVPSWKEAPPIVPAEKESVRAESPR